MDWLRLDRSFRLKCGTCSCCVITGSPVVKRHGSPGIYAAIDTAS